MQPEKNETLKPCDSKCRRAFYIQVKENAEVYFNENRKL